MISYKDGVADKWGYKVGPKDESVRWVKILLEPGHKIAKNSAAVLETHKLLARLGKQPTDVVADYLKCIWEFVKADIARHRGEDWQSLYTTRVILTVPAMWSPAAKDRTQQAAKEAGLPDGEQIQLVTEPEAAALATLKEKSELNDLKVRHPCQDSDVNG